MRSHRFTSTWALLALALLALLVVAHGADRTDPSALLTNAAQVRALSPGDASRKSPVRFQATVTYFEPVWNTLFVQDGTNGVFVAPGNNPRPHYRPGQRVEVEGITEPGYVSQVIERAIRVIGEAPLPEVPLVSFNEMTSGRDDSRLVEVEAIVRSVRTERSRLMFELSQGATLLFAHLPFTNGAALPTQFVHARVRARGVAGMIVNRHGRAFSMRLFVPGLEQMRVVDVTPHNPIRLPDPALDAAITLTPGGAIDQRIRVAGVVTLVWPSGTMFIRQESAPVRLRLGRTPRLTDPEGKTFPIFDHPPVRVGDHVEATGFPVFREPSPVVEDATVRVLGSTSVPPPVPITVKQARSPDYDAELVQITGRVIDVVPRHSPIATERKLFVEAEEKVFEALLEPPAGTMLDLRAGAIVRLTGICSTVPNELTAPADFRMLLRSPNDIVLMRDAPRWLTADILRVAGIAAAVVVALLVWAVVLRRRIAARTAELRETEARFSKAFRSSPAFMTIARLDTGQFVEANEAFLQTTGWKREEVIGRSSVDLRIWVDPQERTALMEDLRNTGYVRNRESHMRLRGGQIVVVLLSAELIEIGNKPHIIAVSTDITPRKRAEAELHKALESEKELSQLKSNFVSMVSHEFRTPLGVISSSSHILQRYFERLPAGERLEHLESITKSVKRMSSLMEEVLVLSKVEAGQIACRPVELDLTTVCERVIDEVLSATNNRCPILLEVLEPGRAMADENLLRHIITNLLSNAVKFSPPGAPVRFTVGRQNGDAIFSVADRGRGIPAADRDKLFDAFHRGANAVNVQGTGLGLTIVKRCVELHQGGIFVQSEEGKGTTFEVRLPLFRYQRAAL